MSSYTLSKLMMPYNADEFSLQKWKKKKEKKKT